MTAKSIVVNTTVNVPVYTTPAGYARLDEVLTANRCLYNAALQHRRDAYKMAGHSISKAAQSRELTLIGDDAPFWKSVSRRIAVGTLERIDLAFAAFFRRIKAGEKPGYPRFKSASRFNTLTMYVEPAWFKTPRRIRVKGLPLLRLRAPLPEGKPLTLRLIRRRHWSRRQNPPTKTGTMLPSANRCVAQEANRENPNYRLHRPDRCRYVGLCPHHRTGPLRTRTDSNC